ncbi:MAG: chromosome segregation ATPase [Paraglaciecola sp.]|jgi:chromosome segregation ATPase
MSTDKNKDEIPSLALDKDDVDSYHRARSVGSKKSSPADESVKPDNQGKAGGPSWLAVLLLVVLLAGAIGYGFYTMQLQQQVVINAQERISNLERRLSDTGEEMGESAVAMQVRVTELSDKTQELWEQMDKLWASAWRKNQAEIKDLSASMTSRHNKLEQNISAVRGENDVNATTIGLLQEQLDFNVTATAKMSTLLAQVEQTATDTEQQMVVLREKLMSTALANNGLASRLTELERWRKSAEEQLNSSIPSAKPTVTTVTAP